MTVEQYLEGFSEANLKNMRQFYQAFPELGQFSTQCVENPNSNQLATQCVASLSWTNIRQIMRLENKAEREDK